MSSDDDVLDNKFTGFGRRTNGTCEEEESNCGPTTRGQSACCPRGMFCTGDSNTACCPTDDDCTDVLLETPRCADADWQMYNNTAPFCCDDAVAAFNTSQNSNICAESGFQPVEGDHTLPEIDQEDDRGSASKTNEQVTATPSGSSSSSSGTAGVEGGEKSDSSNNVGAIAGGVVGGVVGLALILFLFWYLRRRQNRKKAAQSSQGAPPAFALSEKDSAPNAAVGRMEMDGRTGTPAAASELDNPEQVGLMGGYYKTTEHQKPGERAELT